MEIISDFGLDSWRTKIARKEKRQDEQVQIENIECVRECKVEYSTALANTRFNNAPRLVGDFLYHNC